MVNPNHLEQETIEKVQPQETTDKAALENKIDQSRPATDNTSANPAKTVSDNQTLKDELPVKQYDAQTEASARLENTDKKLRFGELDSNQNYERNGYSYETDSQGRVTRAYGQLELKEGVRTGHQTEVGHQGQEGDHGGHLVATRFDGSPEGVNLVPQDGNLNQGEWRKMENEWAKALESDLDVQVEISVHYPDTQSVRPDKFIVDYEIDGLPYHKQFWNKPGG